jgi:membrane-bound metal-dependent hydrolase YbcI (DUF457 family)
MLLRTHLAIGIFAIILFLPISNNPLVFLISALVGIIIPDIDTPFSKIGKSRFSRVVHVFTEHRGLIHSLTFCLIISIILAVFIPVVAFGFFLGFSLHLLSDSFTKSGIAPFWPYKKKATGVIVTGGVVEKGIFAVFVIIDLLLIAKLFLS